MVTAPRATQVRLRDVTEADLPLFFEHQVEPEANAMAAFPARDLDAFLKHWHTNVLPVESAIKQTIEADGVVVGYIGSWLDDGVREVGYWIGKEHWGKGVASQALSLFLSIAVDRPMQAHVAKHNAGSIRVLEKCGFVVIGEDSIASDVPGVGQVEEWIMRLDG